MATIGIIGAGIGGLHLGLLLRQHGIPATIYTSASSAQLLASRLSNVVLRSAPTRARERALGVDHWSGCETELAWARVYVGGERTLAFSGRLSQPAGAVDMRLYCARLLDEFTARGGRVQLGVLQRAQIDRLAEHHDLLVVASGRGNLARMFPHRPDDSPFQRPQRLVIGGLFRGIAPGPQPGYDVAVRPGHGEMIAFPIYSFQPHTTGLGIEIVPGGPWEPLLQLRTDGTRRFDQVILAHLREHAPTLFARTDPTSFGLARPLDVCHAAITPAVRQGYVPLANGTFALALGDAYATNDPLTGQGANTASHAAWVVGEAICSTSGRLDEAFCRQVEQRVWSYTRTVTEACNARLRPPAPHAAQLLAAAARHPAIADRYAEGFNHPDRWWRIVADPERTRALIQQFETPGVTEAPRAA